MSICFYITAHGYGHAVRELAIINQIPDDIPIIIRSEISESFLAQELRRPAQHLPAAFDCGAVQHDAVNVDWLQTLVRYTALQEENQHRLNAECQLLQEQKVKVVVSDVASFPLRVAHQAGIRSVLIGNFTWADIYSQYVERYPEYRPMLQAMREEYRLAGHGLKLPFSLPMQDVPNCQEIGVVCRQARAIRADIAEHTEIDVHKRWVLVYVGQGETAFDWNRFISIEDTIFFVLGRDAPALANVVPADPIRFGGQNIIASCDLVVAKPGYGIVADCVATGTPLLYTSRLDFAEFIALDQSLRAWRAGHFVEPEVFYRGDLSKEIAKAAQRVGRICHDLTGAQEAATILVQHWRE